MMMNQSHSILVFLKEDLDGVHFPFYPEQVWDESYSFHCISYGHRSPLTDEMDKLAKYDVINYYDMYKFGGVAGAVASVIHSPDVGNNTIYTVHPNSVLLPIYRWYLMKNGLASYAINQQMQSISRRVVDICEAFHKPMVLTLDRRQSFNYRTIQRWMELPGGDTPLNNCLESLKYICHKL